MFGLDDAAIGLIAAGAISSAGSIYANNQNLKLQYDTNNESIRLANTAHQREVADLRAAGLNPILSASGSGASVPTLGVASQVNPGQGISDGISSASKLLSQEYKENIKATRANTENTNLVNSAQKLDNEVLKQQSKVDKLKSLNDEKLEMVRNRALEELTGIYDDNNIFLEGDMRKAIDLEKEAITSGIKMRANENIRANFKSASDFLNGTADFATKGKKLKTPTKLPKPSPRTIVIKKYNKGK